MKSFSSSPCIYLIAFSIPGANNFWTTLWLRNSAHVPNGLRMAAIVWKKRFAVEYTSLSHGDDFQMPKYWTVRLSLYNRFLWWSSGISKTTSAYDLVCLTVKETILFMFACFQLFLSHRSPKYLVPLQVQQSSEANMLCEMCSRECAHLYIHSLSLYMVS